MNSCSVRRQNMSHVVIDLGRSNNGMSLSISQSLGHRKRKVKNVKSALIMTQQAKHNRYLPWQHDNNTDRNHEQTMLTVLKDFPNLTALTIDLSYSKLRVATLSGVLQATGKSLKELSLRNLVLVGNLCDQNELEDVLGASSSHSSINIQSLILDRCRGTATVRTLLTKISSLRRVKIIASRISQSDVWASVTLVEMCRGNPKLRSLTLQNVLGLEDQHIFQMVEVLRSKNNSNRGPMLHELHFASAKAGEIAGEDILSLLMPNDNNAESHYIGRLTLNLGGTWSPGPSVGRILSSNNTALRKLELRITGTRESDAASNAKDIAKALSCNQSKLTHLELNMDLISMTASGQYQEILQAFEACLKRNDNLESLRFCDTSSRDDATTVTNGLGVGGGSTITSRELTPFLQMKLDLNRSGLLRLLQSSNNINSNSDNNSSGQSTTSLNAYLKAMTRANQNLSVLFYALHNNPALFCFGQVMATTTTPRRHHPFNLRIMDSSLGTSTDAVASSSTKVKVRERHHHHHHSARHRVAVKRLFQHIDHC